MSFETPQGKRLCSEMEPESPLSPKTVGQLQEIIAQTIDNRLKSTLDEKLSPVLNKLDALGKTLDKKTSDVTEKVSTLSSELTSTKVELQILKQEHAKLQDRVIYMEAQSRRNNLRFIGIEETGKESWEDSKSKVREFLLNHLKMENDVVAAFVFERCHRLGRQQNYTKTRPIIVRFALFTDRELVWKARFNLKGTKYFIAEDFPREIEERRRKLRPYLAKCKELARTGESVEAKLILDRLVVNGASYSVDTISSLPREILSVQTATHVIDNSTVAFWGEESVFSNHHPSDFVVDGQKFTSMEQYLMFSKAGLFDDSACADSVLKTDDCKEQLKLGKKVKGFQRSQWDDAAPGIAKKGLLAKFTDNPDLGQALRDTQSMVLVEASPYDCFWGAGLRAADPRIQSQDQWLGKNILGKLLQEVRSEI